MHKMENNASQSLGRDIKLLFLNPFLRKKIENMVSEQIISTKMCLQILQRLSREVM